MKAQEFVTEISDQRLQHYLQRAGSRVDRRLERMAQARERLNKGYEIYHADRPAGGTQIAHRFEANSPAEAQRYYERYIRDYISDVDFDLRLRRSTGVIEEALHFVRPGELRGSYSDQQMLAMGFRRAKNGSWYIDQRHWDTLIQKGLLK